MVLSKGQTCLPRQRAKHVSQSNAQIDTEENHDPFDRSSKPETSHSSPVKKNQILSCSDLVFLQGRLAEAELRGDCNTSGSMKSSTPPALVGWLSSHVLKGVVGGGWWVGQPKRWIHRSSFRFLRVGFSEQPHQNVTKRPNKPIPKATGGRIPQSGPGLKYGMRFVCVKRRPPRAWQRPNRRPKVVVGRGVVVVVVLVVKL